MERPLPPSRLPKPRSSAEPKDPLLIGRISENPPPPRIVTIDGVTYTRIDERTIQVGNRRITFHPNGPPTETYVRIIGGSDLGGDPREDNYVSSGRGLEGDARENRPEEKYGE